MTERWRRALRRLEDARPTDGLLERAREGSTPRIPDRRRTSPMLAGVVAFSLFAASGVLVWNALGPTSERREDGPSDAAVTYPSPPASGYYILLPDRAVPMPGEGFRARVTALTNLPEGTLLDISTTDTGTCCPPVEDSRITFETEDGACYGLVGTVPSGEAFEATITARPDLDQLSFPGPVSEGEQPQPPEQPPEVLGVLGPGFTDLSGDQVQEQADGSKWLVATGRVMWSQPRCGGDPLPMFGGSTCDPGEFQNQLQGDDLAGAMVDVMGAISQGRMCEFWSVMLPPDVEAEHPWPAFADEWRSWLLQQDFSGAEPTEGWSTGPLHWEQTGGRGDTAWVDVIHDGERIATLELTALPEFCPDCGKDVVPFWGVTGWDLRMTTTGVPATGPTGSSAPADVLTTREDDDDLFTATYPIEWFAAADPINDRVCAPYEILTLATYPVRPGGEAVTDFQLPSRAVEDLGPNDILIWLNENGSACGGTRDSAGPSGFPDRPAQFGPVHVCGDFDLLCPSEGRNLVPGIRGWWIAFHDAGRSFYVFVGMGEEAYNDPERQQQAWDVLDSLRFLPR